MKNLFLNLITILFFFLIIIQLICDVIKGNWNQVALLLMFLMMSFILVIAYMLLIDNLSWRDANI